MYQYEDWPSIEFSELQTGVLDLFTKNTAESVAHSILRELCDNSGQPLRIITEEHLRWCIQVINHALSLPFVPEREFGSVERAVRVYTHWLRALTDTPDSAIPAPLLDTPEKYFRTIVDSLRAVFVRRVVNDARKPLVVSRQAAQIDSILETVCAITAFASRKYQDEVWARCLTFLLNCSDLLVSEPSLPEDIGWRAGSRVVDVLMDLWLKAVVLEQVPSPSYWKTLSVLAHRWRHHVPFMESWARKLLSLSVLVVNSMYGSQYCNISISDESVRALSALPSDGEEEGPPLLFTSWMHIISLIGPPHQILDHDPSKNKNTVNISPPSADAVAYSTQVVPYCFFLSAWALQRMVDVFYGDPRVSIEFKERDVLLQKWSMMEERRRSTLVPASSTVTAETAKSPSTVGTSMATAQEIDKEGTLTHEGRASFSSTTSGRTSGGVSVDKKQKLRSSDRSSKNGVPVQEAVAPSLPTIQSSEATISAVPDTAVDSAIAASRPTPSQLVAHALKANPGCPPWEVEHRPKSERLLALLLPWLLPAALVKTDDGSDNQDVISGLSVCSTEGEDLSSMHSRSENAPHSSHSYAGSSASSSGAADSASAHAVDVGTSESVDSVDAVSAGKAAAVATLCRIVCSKSTLEKLPPQQLASFYAMLHQVLMEKDRVVLSSLFYHGHSLFRLALPGAEALLPHWLYALDLVLIESSKLRLHPSFPETEMRAHCLAALATVVSWPTTFGLAKIPQVAESANLKSAATTYLQLRSRVFKTLIFCLRNETDSSNLQMTLAMCSVLVEESAAFDLGLTEEQTKEMLRISAAANQEHPEKGLCTSFVRGLVSAVCDRMCRPEWASDFAVSLGALDLLNAISSLHPSILFKNKDMSTGSLIVSSLCRFIETQLVKPPPMHSKDLHSSVVSAYLCIVTWLNAAPLLAECESVLNTVAEAVQLGVTGARKHDVAGAERKAASKRVLEAAECLLFSLFSIVGRKQVSICDERRLLYKYGPSAIDTTKFVHLLVNGDTLLSLHEASHIKALSNGEPCVLYVRRSPLQAACVGIARLHPSAPSSLPNQKVSTSTALSLGTGSPSSQPVSPVSSAASPNGNNGSGTPIAVSLSQKFVIPPEFDRPTCKLDETIRSLELTSDADAVIKALEKAGKETQRDTKNVWNKMAHEQRIALPPKPSEKCNSVRIFLYDMGLVEKDGFGSEVVLLDSGQSADFYADMQRLVDSSPARTLQTAHIFYVKDGQRSAVDILENALNVQNTCSDFCGFLSGLGEGVEVGRHESWTGHACTAFSSDRKPWDDREPVDHYILDGVSHILWKADASSELAFLMPTERSVRHFRQTMPHTQARSARRSSLKSYSGHTTEDDLSQQDGSSTGGGSRTKSTSNVGVDRNLQPYQGGSSSVGSGVPCRRNGALIVMVVWLERLEDLHHFPAEDLLPACDTGMDPTSTGRPSYLVIFLYHLENGLVQIATRGSPSRFGEAGPLVDGVVVALSSLSSLLTLTLLNIARRNVAEVENYQLTHIRRRQSIADFGRKYAASVSYEDFLISLIQQ